MDILFLQVVLYCLLFTLLVALSYRGNAINIIYFYPKSVIDKVVEFSSTQILKFPAKEWPCSRRPA